MARVAVLTGNLQDTKRAPEMYQTKKDNKRYFGMSLYAGVEAGDMFMQ